MEVFCSSGSMIDRRDYCAEFTGLPQQCTDFAFLDGKLRPESFSLALGLVALAPQLIKLSG